MGRVQRALTLEGLKRVVLRTPVDTGRARGNWQVTIGKPATNVIDVPLTRQETIIKGSRVTSTVKPFDVIYISNNLSYIGILEFGGFVPTNPGPSADPRRGRYGRILVAGGYSTQAPHGMLETTFQELKGILK